MGSTTTSAAAISFDGYLQNFAFAYNFVSTSDDDIALKGSPNPSPAGSGLLGGAMATVAWAPTASPAS